MDHAHGTIERGKILTAAQGEYTVSSYDRDGIVTPPVEAINNITYSVGDDVYYFIFPDGTGKIICSF